MQLIHFPGTHIFSFYDPWLRRWRLLNNKDSESRVSLVEQLHWAFRAWSDRGHWSTLIQSSLVATEVSQEVTGALTESLSPLTMKLHLVAVLHTRWELILRISSTRVSASSRFGSHLCQTNRAKSNWKKHTSVCFIGCSVKKSWAMKLICCFNGSGSCFKATCATFGR